MRRLLCALAVSASASAFGAGNCSFTIGASDAGWYNASGFHESANRSYFAGYHASSGMELRNWFVFDLPVFDEAVSRAELRLFTFDIRSTNDSLTLELHHVATPLITLTNGGSGKLDVFHDLGDGPMYATRMFSRSEHDSYVSIAFDTNELAALTAASGQRFAIGGKVFGIQGTNEHSLFGYSVGSATYVQLTVFVASSDEPAFISQPPANHFITSGGTLQLTAEACGATPLRYRWFFNGALIPLQTNATLTIANAGSTHAGNYFAVVTNGFGAATSSVTRVFVDARPPTIFVLNYQPEVEVGGQINIQATLDGLPYPNLQWKFNGSDIPGATNAILFIERAELTNAGTYTLTASNAYGLISRSLVIAVFPYLISGPYDVAINSGIDSYLTVFVGGFRPSIYQWRFNGINIPGANAASLPLFNVSTAITGRYDVVVSNSLGVRTSAVAQVSVVGAAPRFEGFLASGLGIVDSSLALSVAVYGSSPIHLQWYFNNAAIPLATNSQLAFSQLTTNHSGSYFVVASNAFGVTNSFSAFLNVQEQASVVATVNSSATGYAGDAKRLLAQVEGGPRPTVQWRFAGTNIPGATNASLLLTNLVFEQAGDYTCVVTNRLGTHSATIPLGIFPRRALDRWTWRHPRPQANDLHHIAFGNGRYVAGGEGGTLVTSTNAVDWTATSLGNDYSVSSLAYGNGVFVALVNNGVAQIAFTSLDGITWTPRDVPELNYLTFVAFVAGQFRVYGYRLGGSSPWEAVSVDGVHWNSTIAPSFDYAPDSMAYGNGRYVASAYYYPFVSNDGVQFTRIGLPSSGLKRVTFGGGKFIMVGDNGGIWTSADALHWTQRNAGTVLGLAGVASGNGRFVAVGNDGTILSSNDGTTWTASDADTGKNLNDILFDGAQFVVCGNDGLILTSVDGASWTDRRGGRTDDLEGIIYTNGLFVAVGAEGTILTSSDGEQWTTRNSPNSRNLHGITYAAGQFVAVGRRGTVLTSPDAINWTSRSTPTTNYMQRVTYGNGRYVAIGTAATVISSTNGIQWQLHSNNLPETTEMEGVVFGKGRFVIVGGYFAFPNDVEARSITLVSTNGTDWAAVSNDVGKILRGVTFGGDRFQAVGNDGITVFSADGLNWRATGSVQSVAPYRNLRHVIHAAGRFIAVGNEGAVVSALGTNWTEHASIVSQNLHDIAFGAGKFVAVGNEGLIVQSDDALPRFAQPTPADGALHFNVRGGIEPQYRVQSTADFVSWTNAGMFTNQNGASVSFTNSIDSPRRFYRTVNP